jgi:hypothetical protein
MRLRAGKIMDKDAREALQVTKEIVVKFIETSRVSPANFAEIFPGVYQVVLETILRAPFSSQAAQESAERFLAAKGREA